MQVCPQFTSAGYRLKVFNFPSGVTEAVSVFVPGLRKPSAELVVSVERSDDEMARREADNARRATARAKAAVRRLCLSADCDRMLTLTFRDNIEDIDAAWAAFVRFVRLVRVHYGRWVYVAVAERQKRGAVHFHCAVRGWQDVGFLRKSWLHVVGEGNIDVTSPERFKGRSGGARASAVARYLTKYLLKEARLSEARHRYRHSRITLPFTVVRLEATNALAAGNEALAACMAGGGKVQHVFFGSDFGLTWCVGWREFGS